MIPLWSYLQVDNIETFTTRNTTQNWFIITHMLQVTTMTSIITPATHVSETLMYLMNMQQSTTTNGVQLSGSLSL